MDKTFGNLFLSVGAMKAGTTWLYGALNRHPALHFAAEKEVHYFYQAHFGGDLLSAPLRHRRARQKYIPILRGAKGQQEFPASRLKRFIESRFGRFLPQKPLDLTGLSDQGRAWVEAYLSEPVDDAWFNRLFPLGPGEVYACEFSNLSAHLPAEVWADLHARSQKLKVLYTLRDPIKRLWSHTKFQLQMTQQLHMLERWTPQEYEAFARSPAIWDNAEYGQACAALMQGLPPEALRIQSYEEMTRTPQSTLAEIERFLEVPAFQYPKWMMTRRPTKSVSVPMPEFFPGLFAADVARIKTELADLGLRVQNDWL